MSELVYVIRCERFVKIGKSSERTLPQRLTTLQIGSPYQLVLAGTIPCKDGEATERIIHAQLDRLRLRVRGEWFLDTPMTKRVLESHCYEQRSAPRRRRRWASNGAPIPPLLPVRGGSTDF